MNKNLAWAAIVGSTAWLSACSMMGGGEKSREIEIDPIFECKGKGTVGTCDTTGSGPMVCHVRVTGEGADMTVTPFTVKVPRPPDPSGASTVRPAVIVWHADENGYKFTERDGPPELKSHGQFKDGKPTDDPNGAPGSAAEGKKYRITFLNGPLGAGGVYYTVAVRKGNRVSRCDPRISNDGF
jgi:hypothetical protein